MPADHPEVRYNVPMKEKREKETIVGLIAAGVCLICFFFLILILH